MFLRLFGLLGVAWCCLTFVGCQAFSDEPPDKDQSKELDREVNLALDVEVQVELHAPTQLSARPERLLEIRVDEGSGLRVSDESLNDAGVAFMIRGTKIGVHRLVVNYETEEGKRLKETFVVSVQEIDLTRVRPVCTGGGSRNSIPIGAEVRVGGSAYDANDNRLDIDDLNVVKDAAAFELVDAKENTWRAPQTPGRYEWRLLGKNSKRFEWVVYDPASSRPRLEVATRTSSERAGVSVALAPTFEEQAIDVCLLPNEWYVDLEVVDGECYPAVGGVAFDKLSLRVASERDTFWVAGSGNCRVRASSPSGTSVETSLNADIQPEPFYDLDYVELEDEGIELDLRPKLSVVTDRLLAACPNDSPIHSPSLNCPSGFHSNRGCIERTHWKIDYVRLGPAASYAGVGVGLLAELEVYLRIEHAGLFDEDVTMLPNFLDFTPQSSQLETRDLSCTQNKHVFQVTPLSAGEHAIELSARDTTHGGHTHTVKAIDVARSALTATPVIDVVEAVEDLVSGETANAERLPNAVEQTATASVRHSFAGELGAYRLTYFDAKDRPLRGVGPVVIEKSEENADVRVARLPDRSGFGVFVGANPTVVSVTSPYAPDAHRLYVEDAQSINAIAGLELPRLTVGQVYCVELHPLADDGLLITGRAPMPPVVTGSHGVFRAFEQDGKACFVAHSAGQADLKWTWGSAEEPVSWFVD